eukprot:TRINITY_DN4049_c0_g2_i1.p4 TRINITY_DN4049_c0_g2~~TRINITY_DN4049_c0_g2_i1.p4  ORF type:complete len:109 (-),score=25.56 TRINITY_DN4049_c0_g2_i1:715-1041(-)
MKFGDERCNWRTIIRNEVLNAFAPRSAWIWKANQTSKISSPKDNTRVLSYDDEPKFSKLLGRLKMAKKILLNSQHERNKSSTTKTDEATDKKIKSRLIICNGSKVSFI